MSDRNRKYDSLESVTSDFSEQTKNSLKLLEVLNKVSVSQDTEETVEVEIDGVSEEVSVPTIARLRTDIDRLDKTVKNLSGTDESITNVRMPDGSFRRIHLSKLPTAPPNLDSLNVPSQFKTKNNWFFEEFISPYLFVDFDVSGQIDQSVRRAKVKRYILGVQGDVQREYWNDSLSGNSEIEMQTFLENIKDLGIEYQIDEDVVDLPLNTLAFKGEFNVEEIRDQDLLRTVGGTKKQILTRIYKLDKLTYLDTREDGRAPGIRTLTEGDRLILNDGHRNTKFKIIYLDNSSNEIAVERMEGYGAIVPGENRLKIYTDVFQKRTIEVGVGPDEKQVVFIKPIDEDFNLSAREWSSGVGFDSATLTIDLPRSLGGRITLGEFYKRYAVDFGVKLFNDAQERIPPAIYAEVPNAPVLSEQNFDVRQINRHITESSDAENLKELYKEKLELNSKISAVNINIREVQDFLVSQSLSQQERQESQTRLEELNAKKDALVNSLKGVVDQIVVLGRSNPGVLVTNKYRVRGFWDMPQPRISPKTLNQEVVKFIVRYRYIRTDGSSSDPDMIEYTDNNGATRMGIFSRWNEIHTPERNRVFDTERNRWVWEEQETENSNQLNVNSLDIPINFGESVEIKVRSVSEAGWPTSPAIGEWSESIIIPFPEELQEQNSVTQEIFRDALEEQLKIKFQEELAIKGLTEHLAGQRIINERLFLHSSNDIAVVKNDGETGSLQAEISDLRNRIRELERLIFISSNVIDVPSIESENDILEDSSDQGTNLEDSSDQGINLEDSSD